MQNHLPDAIQRLPRLEILDQPTPIQRLVRLEAALGDGLNGVRIFVKRDDHIPIGGGGNKLRKLEFLLGDAIHQGADTLITVGGLQSNHARLTAAVAARQGLACHLVLGKAVPRTDRDYEQNGNVLLDRIFGAHMHVLETGENTLAFAEHKAEQLRSAGHVVAVIPTGGSTPLGALGYAVCAEEIQQFSARTGTHFSKVMVANGSSGTHAGLAAGFASMGLSPQMVHGFAVLVEALATAETTLKLTNQALQLLGGSPVALTDIEVDGSHRGSGYGIPTDGMFQAVQLLARTEGLLLDPVYSGKAFAGMLADIRAGAYSAGDNLLFVMTGGTPGLYAYQEAFE